MTIKQKLKLIKKVSGLTQEKLAKKLSVSFATLNSWIRGRSMPRKKAQEKIDELYREYTGQKIIPADILQAKKQIIQKKGKKYKNVIKRILNNPDIYDELMLALTYNSNRIEGNTLSEPETAAILFQNAALPNKSLTEHLEVKNLQAALQYLFKYIDGSQKIDESLILKLHSILMNGIRQDAGAYRKHGVRIVGANVPTANYLKIPKLMHWLVEDIGKTRKDIVAHAAEIHARFEQIHPFSDGNGRIGRLIMHAMLLRKNLAPAIIKQEKRRFYYLYLQKAQQKNELSQLEDFVCDAVIDGFDLVER